MSENQSGTTLSKKRGNKFGFWFFKISIDVFGLSGAYGLLYFVCFYYLIFDRAGFSSCMAYINRRFKGYGFFQRVFGVYRIFVNQGKNFIDRYYSISGLGSFDLKLNGYDKISRLLKESDKGFILLTAHVGNWQVTMRALEGLGRTVNLLMRPEDNAAVKDVLNIDGEAAKLKIISTEGLLGGVVESVNAINRGEIVSIMGDRSYGADSVKVDFLGDSAQFPYAAFKLAAAVRCPVVVLLSAKVSAKGYVVDTSMVIEPTHTSRNRKQQDIKGWVQEFANVLEGYVAKYPYQWFVFYDIWDKENKECLNDGEQ